MAILLTITLLLYLSLSLPYYREKFLEMGFRIGRRVVKLWRTICRRKRRNGFNSGYSKLRKPEEEGGISHGSRTEDVEIVRKKKGRILGHFGDVIRRNLSNSSLVSWNKNKERVEEKKYFNPSTPPKGHLAVYVGEKDGNLRRYLIPLIYFNHPLFGELLRESEEQFGYNQPGGITIPCQVSYFESVKNRIAGERSPAGRRKASGLLHYSVEDESIDEPDRFGFRFRRVGLVGHVL